MDRLFLIDSREDHHREIDTVRAPLVEYLQPKETGHQVVDDRKVDRRLAPDGVSFDTIIGGDHRVAMILKGLGKQHPDSFGIVGDENARLTRSVGVRADHRSS